MPEKKEAFPKKVFISRIHECESSDDYFAVDEHLQDIDIGTGERITVGVYELKTTIPVTNVNQII